MLKYVQIFHCFPPLLQADDKWWQVPFSQDKGVEPARSPSANALSVPFRTSWLSGVHCAESIFLNAITYKNRLLSSSEKKKKKHSTYSLFKRKWYTIQNIFTRHRLKIVRREEKDAALTAHSRTSHRSGAASPRCPKPERSNGRKKIPSAIISGDLPSAPPRLH